MTLLPRAIYLGKGERRALRVSVALLWITIALAAAHTFLGLGGDGADTLVRDWASSLVYVLVAAIVGLRALRVSERRAAWIVLAIGVALYGAGNLLWALWLEHVETPPIPSACDGLWLALYPFSYIGVAMLARENGRKAPAGVWLDGIVAGLAVTALGAAVVFAPVMAAATGPPLAVATNLAYPIFDLLLAALAVGVLALRGWRVDALWALLGGGFLVLAVADSIYLMQVTSGSSESSTLANVFYMSGVGMLALAAWQPQRPAKTIRVDSWSTLVVPAGFVVAVLGLLVYDHVNRLDDFAVLLAIATVALALVRTAFTFRDVRALSETRRLAVTDDLTELPNRRQFLSELDRRIAAARLTREPLALMIVDLDHFKELNDTLGHHAGDMLLRQIGPRLRRALRATDTVARLGGDEFGLMLGGPIDSAGALRVSAAIRVAIAEPFEVRGLQLQVAASVGIAMFPEHGADGDELLQRADVAMYQAKGRQTGGEVYAPDRDRHSRERLALGGELKRGIDAGELEVHYQPKVATGDRRIVGFEALVRWRHPERGLLGPYEFVPIAEQSGLARALTREVVAQALEQCRIWRGAGNDLHIAVNLTVADLLDTDLPREIAAALERHDVPPEALVLEVTESSVLADPVRIGDVLGRLGELGVGLALDDFGTGYSSLTHLRNLPVSEVKIDRSFVARMGADPADAAIVASTLGLARALGMRTVAEGVEDEDTWSELGALDCDLIQGYAYSRPVVASAVASLLEAGTPTA